MAETQYPDNSHRGRESQSEGTERNKLEKVVTGSAKTRKKSEARKFASVFVPEDVEDVKSYILFDVVVPGIKNAIADAVNIILFGDARRSGKKGGSSRVSYGRMYDDRNDDRRDSGRARGPGGFDLDDIIFDRRGDAELVLEQLQMAIEDYDSVSVADLYDLAGVTCKGYTAFKYGWTNLSNAKVVRIRDGYILQLPKTVHIT